MYLILSEDVVEVEVSEAVGEPGSKYVGIYFNGDDVITGVVTTEQRKALAANLKQAYDKLMEGL